MAKNRNTHAKRSREADKRRKAQDKVERRRQRKDRPESISENASPDEPQQHSYRPATPEPSGGQR